jgi:predicted RNA-binding protein with PIN domain
MRDGDRPTWLVDGMNVIGSRPTGWWRDRPGAMRNLVERLEAFASATGDDVTVVFDGRPHQVPAERVRVLFAPGGRNAADHEIARLVEEADDPSSIRVVTSDRELVARVRQAGAHVTGSGEFLRRLEGAGV